jgi:hypothetical protein
MIDGECPNCGDRISILANSCPGCGAPSPARRARLVIAGALAALLIAIGVASIVVVGGHRLPATVRADAPAGLHGAAGATDDVTWLTTAMSTCETDAENDAGTLRFLVIPLAPVQKDDEQGREKALNEVGNAVLLGSDDAVEGIKDGTLRIYPGEYDFRVLDDATGAVYKWKPADGVANFSTADSGSIALFKVQFRTPRNSGDGQWGTAFVRQSGTCYWVSAVIAH